MPPGGWTLGARAEMSPRRATSVITCNLGYLFVSLLRFPSNLNCSPAPLLPSEYPYERFLAYLCMHNLIPECQSTRKYEKELHVRDRRVFWRRGEETRVTCFQMKLYFCCWHSWAKKVASLFTSHVSWVRSRALKTVLGPIDCLCVIQVVITLRKMTSVRSKECMFCGHSFKIKDIYIHKRLGQVRHSPSVPHSDSRKGPKARV